MLTISPPACRPWLAFSSLLVIKPDDCIIMHRELYFVVYVWWPGKTQQKSCCTSFSFEQSRTTNLVFLPPIVTMHAFQKNKDLLVSSVASPLGQEGQSKRTFPIFAFSSRFFLFFPDFSPLFPKFPDFFAFFCCQRGHSAPLPPYWLRHCCLFHTLLNKHAK